MNPDWYTDHGGEGPLLVLLHGGTRTRADWDACASLLRADFRVVVPDLAGHGQRRNEQFDMTRSVDDVDALIAAVGVTKAVVVGHSMGGIIATAHAAERDSADVVVNVDGVGVSVPTALRSATAAHNDVLALIDDMRALVGDREPEASLARAVAVTNVFELTRIVRRPCLVVVATGDHPAAGDRSSAAMQAWRDAAVTEFRRIAAENPRVAVATLASSHFVPLDRPKELARLITRWARS